MKTRALKNYYGSIGCEVYDIDLATCTDEEIMELGRLVEDQCTVFIDKECFNGIDKARQAKIMTSWGTDNMAMMHGYVANLDPIPDHWLPVRDYMHKVSRFIPNKTVGSMGMTNIGFGKDENGDPTGMFTHRKILDWHQDQTGVNQPPRMIGLVSERGSAGSRTDFLQTFDMWENLSSEMQSVLKELRVKHVFRGENMAYGLGQGEANILRYNMVPLDGIELDLYNETPSGRPGLHFPAYTFNGFVGMSDLESWKLYAELTKLVYDSRYTYQHEWQDGQIMFFDQAISLHRRSTVYEDSPDRNMTRTITLMDKLYPNAGYDNPKYGFQWYKGEKISNEEFLKLVDADRKRRFETGDE